METVIDSFYQLFTWGKVVFRNREALQSIEFMTDAGQRLKVLREGVRPKLSIRKMAEELGIPASTYATRENETKSPFMRLEWVLPIADILEKHGVPREQVMELAGADAEGIRGQEVEVAAWVQAGNWTENNEIDHDERERVAWPFRQKKPDGIVALEVRGDSMDMMYPSGSVVFAQDPVTLSESGKSVELGDIVVARRRNDMGEFEYTLKELAQAPEGGFLLLPRSRNLVHRPIPYEPLQEWYIGHHPADASADSLCIVGVVVGALISYMDGAP